MQTPVPRPMQFALFLTGGLWVLGAKTAADHAASGLVSRLHLAAFQGLLAAAFLLFLLLIGFTAIHWVATRQSTVREVNALPLRPTARREWTLGAALGWALLIVALVPMLAARDLSPSFWLEPRGFGLALLSVFSLLLFTLALELAFRGYVFVRLIKAIGPSAATLLMSAIYAAVSALHPQSSRLSVIIAFVLGVFFSLAYLRTHALWLGWGLHFAWAASMGVLFGLPVGGLDAYTSVVDTACEGSSWVTGGFYGPEGAVLTLFVVLGGCAVLYALTRDLAWQYTYTPIIAAGYAMDVAPPAQHAAMEQAAVARPAPLVQILASTSSASSTMPVIEQHLRSGGDA